MRRVAELNTWAFAHRELVGLWLPPGNCTLLEKNTTNNIISADAKLRNNWCSLTVFSPEN